MFVRMGQIGDDGALRKALLDPENMKNWEVAHAQEHNVCDFRLGLVVIAEAAPKLCSDAFDQLMGDIEDAYRVYLGEQTCHVDFEEQTVLHVKKL